jgi:hypothetical protein
MDKQSGFRCENCQPCRLKKVSTQCIYEYLNQNVPDIAVKRKDFQVKSSRKTLLHIILQMKLVIDFDVMDKIVLEVKKKQEEKLALQQREWREKYGDAKFSIQVDVSLKSNFPRDPVPWSFFETLNCPEFTLDVDQLSIETVIAKTERNPKGSRVSLKWDFESQTFHGRDFQFMISAKIL